MTPPLLGTCGHCGGVLQGAETTRCPHCGVSVGLGDIESMTLLELVAYANAKAPGATRSVIEIQLVEGEPVAVAIRSFGRRIPVGSA